MVIRVALCAGNVMKENYDWAIRAVQTTPDSECSRCSAPLDVMIYSSWGGGDTVFAACVAHHPLSRRERIVARWSGGGWELDPSSWRRLLDSDSDFEQGVTVPGTWCRWEGEDLPGR